MATIWKRKDRDCWAVHYRDAMGKRIRRTVPTRQDAETLLAEKIKETKEEAPNRIGSPRHELEGVRRAMV